MKLSKQRLREIILEEIGGYSREEVNKIINTPPRSGREGAPKGELREPWDGIEENAERLDILSNQIGGLTSRFEQLIKLLAP